MAICPYMTQLVMTKMEYSGAPNSDEKNYGYWKLEEGSPTNEVKWATCNEDGTVTFNGKTETCELWDYVNSRCGTKVSDTIRSPNNETNTLITLLEHVLGKLSEKSESAVGESLLTLWNHYHDSHIHQFPHICVDIPSSCGASEQCTDPPFAVTLVNEYMGNQDMDGNGKIYGIDFKIEDGPNKPKMVAGLETQPDWKDPPEIISWNDYKRFRES